MGLFSMLKKNAKLALKNNWGAAVLIVLIVFGVSILLNILQQVVVTMFVEGGSPINDALVEFIENPTSGAPESAVVQMMAVEWIIIAAFGLLSLLFLAPLSLGEVRWFFRLVHNERMQVTETFHFFETMRGFGRAVWYNINIYIRTLLWAIPFFTVPSGILGTAVYFLSIEDELPRSSAAIASAGVFLAAILMLLASVFYAVCIHRYALVPYFLAENDGITVREAIRESVKYTKGFRFSLFWFELSFIGWFLLCMLALPLLLYVVPYYKTAYSMYARYIIEKKRNSEPNATKEFIASSGSALPEENEQLQGDHVPQESFAPQELPADDGATTD